MHTPDRWLIVKINGNDPHYRVFGSWYGGYLGSDSWRMNSGITKVSEDDDYYHFEGTSGSVYHCHKKAWGISGYGSAVLHAMIEKQKDYQMEIVPQDIDVTTLEY